MARFADDAQLRARPALVQQGGVVERADHVVAAVDDLAGNIGEPLHVVENLVFLDEALVDEIVSLDPGQGQGPVRRGEFRQAAWVHPQGGAASLPGCPSLGRGHAREFVLAGEALVVGVEQAVALALRDWPQEILPAVGEDPARAVAVEPVEVALSAEEYAAQHHRCHPARMRLGVEQAQGCAPGAAEQHPLFDAEIFADFLHVGDEVAGGVLAQFAMWLRAAAAALVEGDDAVQLRVEEAAGVAVAGRAGAAMDEDHRNAGRIAGFVEIQLVQARDLELVPLVRLQFWEQRLHWRLPSRCLRNVRSIRLASASEPGNFPDCHSARSEVLASIRRRLAGWGSADAVNTSL